MKRTLLALTLAVALLIPAALAGAASLPKASKPEIVVPSSIGGVSIGQTEAKARAAWGKGRGRCGSLGEAGNSKCDYGSTELGATGGYASIEIKDGKVRAAMLLAGVDKRGEQLTTASLPLMEMRTEGRYEVGLNSKYSDVKKAAPGGKLYGDPRDEAFFYVIKGKGKNTFTFGFYGPGKRVYQITISNGLG